MVNPNQSRRVLRAALVANLQIVESKYPINRQVHNVDRTAWNFQWRIAKIPADEFGVRQKLAGDFTAENAVDVC